MSFSAGVLANKNMAPNYLWMCLFAKLKHGCGKFLWEPGGGNQAPDPLQVYVKTGIYRKA